MLTLRTPKRDSFLQIFSFWLREHFLCFCLTSCRWWFVSKTCLSTWESGMSNGCYREMCWLFNSWCYQAMFMSLRAAKEVNLLNLTKRVLHKNNVIVSKWDVCYKSLQNMRWVGIILVILIIELFQEKAFYFRNFWWLSILLYLDRCQ